MTAALPAKPGPVAAVIAVVLRQGQVLLVRRRNPPDAGPWGFPGGKIDFGETIAAAAERELLEETAIRGEARRVVTAVDALDFDDKKSRERISFWWPCRAGGYRVCQLADKTPLWAVVSEACDPAKERIQVRHHVVDRALQALK